MALDATVAQKLVKSILESSPNTASAIIQMKDCGVDIGEITRLALDHPALKNRLNEIGLAVSASGGKWPLPSPEAAPVEVAPQAQKGSAPQSSASAASSKKDGE
jgi:hypothetical protein